MSPMRVVEAAGISSPELSDAAMEEGDLKQILMASTLPTPQQEELSKC